MYTCASVRIKRTSLLQKQPVDALTIREYLFMQIILHIRRSNLCIDARSLPFGVAGQLPTLRIPCATTGHQPSVVNGVILTRADFAGGGTLFCQSENMHSWKVSGAHLSNASVPHSNSTTNGGGLESLTPAMCLMPKSRARTSSVCVFRNHCFRAGRR